MPTPELAKPLTEFELLSYIRVLEQVYQQHCPVPGEVLARYHQPARLEFPLGELTNPRIAGFLWAWQRQSQLTTARITASDRFNANGLEGKCIVKTLLSTALLAARELPPYRRRVIPTLLPKK